MTRQSWKIATAATLLLFVAACQTTGPDPNRAIAPTAAAPAEGALVAEAPNFPPVGAKWTDSVGGSQWTSERLPDGDYEGRTVVRVAGRDSELDVFDTVSGNQIATMAANGTKLFSADPHYGTFNWPMFAGKAWTSVTNYQDHAAGRAWVGRTTYWKVEAEEEVTVPAGTFKTLRLQS